MTRFFFDLHDGIEQFTDPEGSEVEDHAELEKPAVVYLAETVFHTLPKRMRDTEVRVGVRTSRAIWCLRRQPSSHSPC